MGAGDSFRLLFVTSTTRNAVPTDISTYTEFVRGRAATGHSASQFSSSRFRVVGSTASVDARDHTGTRYSSSNRGVPIHWLNGDKVADNYQDFYDGSWDNKSGKGKNEFGNSFSDSRFIFTGSQNNGVASVPQPLGGSSTVRTVRLQDSATLTSGQDNKLSSRHFFALSPVFRVMVRDNVRGVSVSITSTPANATPGYAVGETIRVRVEFNDRVSVTGTPHVVLNVAGVARRATYASGSGTRYLNFEYTVQTGDFDSDGISLCSSRFIGPGCGRISLNGGRISAQSDNLAAELDLPALGNQSGHKVDGMPPDPLTPPMANPGTGTVPREGWALKPAGIGYGDSFRLLFVSSTTRNATSTDINDYNQHVINAAGAGHSAIQALKNGFRAIASTEAVDARDNAGLTATGVRIYWLGSNDKVADNNGDLLDGTWDNETAKNESGQARSASFVWTGSTDGGIELTLSGDSLALGGNGVGDTGHVGIGRPNNTNGTPLASTVHGSRTSDLPLYALSQVLRVPQPATRRNNPDEGLEPTSRPPRGDTYRLGETFIFPFAFTEPVVVRGVPTMPLVLDSGTVRARYVSGSGTKRLLFAYTVQTGDYDNNAPRLLFTTGDSYMALNGASVRALAHPPIAGRAARAIASTLASTVHPLTDLPSYPSSMHPLVLHSTPRTPTRFTSSPRPAFRLIFVLENAAKRVFMGCSGFWAVAGKRCNASGARGLPGAVVGASRRHWTKGEHYPWSWGMDMPQTRALARASQRCGVPSTPTIRSTPRTAPGRSSSSTHSQRPTPGPSRGRRPPSRCTSQATGGRRRLRATAQARQAHAHGERRHLRGRGRSLRYSRSSAHPSRSRRKSTQRVRKGQSPPLLR